MLWDSFFWDGAGLARALPGLGGDDTRAAALNDRKQVVGASMTGDGYMRAVIWNANDPPILYVSSRYAGVVNTPVTFTALATDPNEGDTLTFSLLDAPDGAAINAATGVFTWTPTSEAR
jgi:uncharacterized membrane protein